MIGHFIAPEHRGRYDGCSVVDWLPWLGLVAPELDECCQSHDELYLLRKEGRLGGSHDREIADRLFYWCMMRRAEAAPDPARRALLRRKAATRYAAVRAFGWTAWYT